MHRNVLDPNPAAAGSPHASTCGSRWTTGASEPSTSTPPLQSWWMWLLYPFIAIFNFFILDSILPDDNFTMRIRKMALGTLALGSSGYYTTIMGVINEPTGARGYARWFVFLLDGLPMIVAPWAAFVYCRVTKRIPDVLFSILGLTCIFSRVVASVTVHNFDLEPITFAYLMPVLASNVPKPVQLGSIIMSCIALIINTMVLPDIGMDKYVFFPGADASSEVSLMTLVTYRIAFLLKIAGLLVLIGQFNFLVAKAEGAVSVCKLLAEKLQRYDTEAARELLRTLQSGNGDCPMDPELLLVFEGIVENLEEYRPHLPNYMLSRHSPTTEDSEDDVIAQVKAEGDNEGNDLESSGFQVPSEGEISQRALVIPLPDAGLEFGWMPEFVMKSRVSVCIMSVRWESTFPVALCNSFVSIVNRVAHETQASLHSFVGDQIVATWNATRKVAKHEARSCLFPLRVRAAVASNATIISSMTLSSMTATKPAESCFAGDFEFRMFACSSPSLWTLATTGLEKIRHLNIAAADYETKRQAKIDVGFQAVCVLAPTSEEFQSAPTPKHRCLYQLLTEHQSSEDGDQEWMYVVEGPRGGEKKLTKAVETFAAGDAAGALILLKELGDACRGEAAVQALMHEVESSVASITR